MFPDRSEFKHRHMVWLRSNSPRDKMTVMTVDVHDKMFLRERITVKGPALAIEGFYLLGRRYSSKAHSVSGTDRHPDHLEICYIAGGRQAIETGGRTYDLRSSDVFFTLPGEVHFNAGDTSEKCILYYLQLDLRSKKLCGFSSGERDVFIRTLKAMRTRSIRGTPAMKKDLDAVMFAAMKDVPFKRARINGSLTQFLIDIIACAEKTPDTVRSSGIRIAAEHITAHVNDNIAVEDLAATCGLSVPRFTARFKRETGLSPNDYALREKVSAAKAKLIGSTQDITDIAFDLGFSSSQYFATVFKRYAGITPKSYRARSGRTL